MESLALAPPLSMNLHPSISKLPPLTRIAEPEYCSRQLVNVMPEMLTSPDWIHNALVPSPSKITSPSVLISKSSVMLTAFTA